MIFFMLLFILVVILLIRNLYVVKQQTAVIVERFGKFARVQSAGLNIKVPFIESRAAVVDLRTNQESFTIDAKTKDNVTVSMMIAAQYRVSTKNKEGYNGVYLSYYTLAHPTAQMRSYLVDALRSSIPSYTLDEVFEKKDSIAFDVNETVKDKMEEYGYVLTSTLITSINLPQDVEDSMNRINSAQREKAAAQDLAEAERIKVVTEAKAKAEAMEEAGKGIAAQRKAIADGIADSLETIKKSGVSAEEANRLFLFTQWTDMMSEFAKTSDSTVVLPSNFNETSSMFDQMVVSGRVNNR